MEGDTKQNWQRPDGYTIWYAQKNSNTPIKPHRQANNRAEARGFLQSEDLNILAKQMISQEDLL